MSHSLTSRQRKELQDAFDLFDKDRSGKISDKELAAVFKAINIRLDSNELAKVVKMMDIDGSGQIDFEEFCRVMAQQYCRQYTEEELRIAFRQFDQDNSGYIQAKELDTIMQKMGQRLNKAEVDAMVKALDSSGDGKISFEEFVQLFK